MKYIVIEIQTSAEDSVARLVSNALEKDVAEQDYHTRLAAAAVSHLPCHAVAMLDAEGRLIKRESYKHPEEERA